MNMPLNTTEEDVLGFFPLFFRAIDCLRLEGYVVALTQSGMSLSLVSNHEAILDHYSAILLARLRQSAPDVAVEVYFPASSEALLGRFNEILINSSIRDAMDGKVSLAAPRIWMVHDASALPDHEIQLLARLVQHFPAANIRVVLLMTSANQKPNLLSSFGRRILCWDIEPPTPEQADNMLVEARVKGREVAVRSLLKKLSLPLAKSSASDPIAHTALPSSVPVLEDDHVRPETSLPRGGRWKWLLGGVALLIISTLLVAMYYAASQRTSRLNWNWQALLTGGNPMVNDVLSSAPATVAFPLSKAIATANAAATPQVASTASSPALTASGPEKAGGRTEIIREEVIEPAIERPVPINRPSEMLVGQGWVEKMPKGTFLVQHITVPTYQEAMQWLQRHPDMTSAQVVATYLPNQKMAHYVLVSGPFDSLVDATRFFERGGVPKASQIRSALSMKAQFGPTVGEADATKRKEKN